MTAARQLSLFGPPPPKGAPLVHAPGAAPLVDGSSSSTRFTVLGSGSSGNSVLLESRGRRLLVDAGFACRELEARLRQVGVEPRSVEAIVLTHEHADHCRGAARFAARFRIPVYATPGTLRAPGLRRLPGGRPLRAGSRSEIAGVQLEAISVSHDARDPIGVVLEDADGRRLALVSDLGEATAGAWARLRDLSVLLLETNHDLEMLRCGPYPWYLKQRVASARGHLSNVDAARAVTSLGGAEPHTVVLYHLSRINNLPALAYEAVASALERAGSAARVELSDQFQPTSWITV